LSAFTLPGFDLDRFVRETLAEDLGEGLPGGGHDVTSESVIPAEARFAGAMDSRDAIVVAGSRRPFSARSIRRSRSRFSPRRAHRCPPGPT
jgi:nicotinate-nucleotide pyrophosphorylase